MASFKEVLLEAKKHHRAVGAFNVFNYVSARGAIKAAEERQTPIIIQTSASTVTKVGAAELAAIIRLLLRTSSIPAVLHLDHCTDVALAKKCLDLGWDAVMIDASHEPLAANIKITREVAQYAHARGKHVEGEIGLIKGVEDAVSSSREQLATFAETLYYIEQTGIDAVAPAIGTAHGLYAGSPVIDYALVARLSKETACPVVIHGGTGLTAETFTALVRHGANKINISTAIKHAYLRGGSEFFAQNPQRDSPLKLDDFMEASVKEVVGYHIDLFGRRPS